MFGVTDVKERVSGERMSTQDTIDRTDDKQTKRMERLGKLRKNADWMGTDEYKSEIDGTTTERQALGGRRSRIRYTVFFMYFFLVY
jgi:hypothetical protein